MNDLFEEQVKKMTDQELKDIVVHRQNHKSGLVTAVKKELFRRGIELFDIGEEVQENTDHSSRSKESWNWFSPKWNQNIVDNTEAPLLYSRQVINIFSILFTVLFGGVLLAINLKKNNNQKKILPVSLFCIGYSILTTLIIGLLWSRFEMYISIFIVLLNAIGAAFLYNYFWAKYLGVDFKYRTKPIMIPLMTGIVLALLLIWVLMNG